MKKPVLIIIPIIVLVLIVISVLTYFLLSRKTNKIISPLEQTTTINSVSNITPKPANQGEYNILLLGQGGAGHEGGILADSEMIVHINTINKKAALIFIPRDMYVNNMKINEAYSKGGFALAKETVGSITGLSIGQAIVVDFPNFIRLIDSLGGIDINIAKTFDDYFYPVAGKELETCGKSPEEVANLSATLSGFELEKQFTCRYEHLHFDTGKTHIDGIMALKYARSRHSAQDGSDFGRGARQQTILIGIKDKLLTLNALKNVDKIFNSLVKFVKTDLDLATTKTIISLIVNPSEYKISQIVPSDANILKSGKNSQGQFILVPKSDDWQELRNFIKEQISAS
ncbi:MAG: LCP family protein [Candidatus Gottesmanbacteria bacterium]